MKILHVIAQLPTKTGSGIYFTNLVKEFEKKGVDQRILFGAHNEFEYDILSLDKQNRLVFETEEIPYPIVGMSDEMPYKSTRYKDMTEEMFEQFEGSFLRRLEIINFEYNPDIIICHHLWILTALVVKHFSDKKIIGISHGTDLRQANNLPEIEGKIKPWISKLDLIFALNNINKHEIAEKFNFNEENIIVTGGGFDSTIFHRNETVKNDNIVTCIYAGKVCESKGSFELGKAFNELQEEGHEIYLDILGTGKGYDVRHMIDIINNNDRICFYNVVSQKYLGDIFRDHDIFVFPSFYEGLGLVAIEALACGMRVVSNELPGLMEFLPDEINESDLIEYVKMPRLRKIDKPVLEETPEYRKKLKEAILKQMNRVLEHKKSSPDLNKKIDNLSWSGLAETILSKCK